MKYLLLILFLIISELALSECNFPSGKYIEELSDPENISLIEIEIPKSSKYFKNVIKIITSNSENISPNFKKKFFASIRVHYNFGVCDYPGTIRQSGDWKDHISLREGGKIISSLDVKLEQGNILNSIKFKLLIPQTRNGMNEILGSLLLKKAGFIAPETFEVKTLVNGSYSVMLFQENSAKELIEKNFRREGPIFEGDESLLWSYNNFANFELEPLSLSRLENKNWFEKGKSSEQIVLKSFGLLQQSYLNYINSHLEGNNNYALFPNKPVDNIFINYNYTLIAINGIHALRPHNRKFYFNAIESKFEPIYYDGNIQFSDPVSFLEFENLLPYSPEKTFLDLLSSEKFLGDLKKDFLKRIIDKDIKGVNFLETSLNQFLDNQKIINDKLSSKSDLILKMNSNYHDIDNLLNFQKLKKVNQKIIKEISLADEFYISTFIDDKTIKLNKDDLISIISKNSLNKERIIYIPNSKNNMISYHDEKQLKINNGLLITSKDMVVNVNIEDKILYLSQSNQNDWALFLNGQLKDWKFFFDGIPASPDKFNLNNQRFNKNGLTGCFTVYNSNIDNSYFSLINGQCEDSINFIKTNGKNINISVLNAFADAVDADFSNLSIENLDVRNANNDCLDLSGGKYELYKSTLHNCEDKGVSVGEKSFFSGSNLSIINSNIGISSKDSSIVNISSLSTENTSICIEAFQKKQEFGGAKISIENILCDGDIITDEKSEFFLLDEF